MYKLYENGSFEFEALGSKLETYIIDYLHISAPLTNFKWCIFNKF